jgi:hypothetical protein
MAVDTIRTLQNEFDRAELEADAGKLDTLIADDFQSIGPKGFVLDKRQWIGRHKQFQYHELTTSDMDIHLYDKTAIVRDVQRNRATYDGNEVNVATRVSQVWVEQNGGWRLAAIQFSPLADG